MAGGGASLSLVIINRMRENGMLCQGKFRLDLRKGFFSERVVSHLNSLPGKWSWHRALSEFREGLDSAFGHVV